MFHSNQHIRFWIKILLVLFQLLKKWTALLRMVLKNAYIHRPRELKVIQKLKLFNVIFSHPRIVIGSNKMSCTTAKKFTRQPQHSKLRQIKMPATRYTSGFHIFQLHLILHYHHVWFAYKSLLPSYPNAALNIDVISCIQ